MKLGRSQAKLVLRLGLMGLVGIFGILAVSLLSRAMTDITRSEETAAIFNVSAELDHDLIEAVEWLPDVPNLPKQLAPLDREALTDTWLRAWTQFLILSDGSGPVGSAVDGEVTDGIAEYFDGSAANAMLVGAEDWLGLPVHQIGHDLRLTFYSDDGAVVSVTSESSRFLRGQPVDGAIEWYDTTESYDAVFVLQDGNWRIHHWVRRSAEGAWATALDDTPPIPLEIEDMRAITWRPATQTALEFWTAPDLTAAETEFAILGPLGFNTVRIELPFEELGGRNVTEAELFAAAALLDIADENELKVIFSLLNGRTEHQPLHWDADDDHLDDVVGTLGGHPAMALWELSAQPDLHLGIERVDEQMLTAWLNHVARTVRSADDDTPLTIGWSSARAAAEAPAIADVVSFAWPGDMATVAADLDYVRAVSGDRPILIADASHHTHLGLAPGGQTETEQARYFADMLIAVEELGLDGFSVSTLRDFDIEAVAARAQETAEQLDAEEKERIAEQERLFPPPVTPEPQEAGPEVHEAPIVAEVTWPTGADASEGLIRIDGTAKPAAGVFALDADLDGVPGPSIVETIRKPFNLVLAVLVTLGLSGWLFLALWARNKLPIPQIRRPKADGKDAHLRRGRKRKKSSVTAPIEQQQPVAQPIGVAPEAPQPTTEPKTGMLRRAIGWLNAPVLPESDPAAVAPAAEPVVAQATAAPVMMEQPALMEQPVMVQQPVVQQPVVQQQVMAQPAAMAQAAVMTEPVVPQPTAQPVMAQPQVMTQPVMAQPVVQQPVVQQQVMQPVVETTAPVQVQPIQTQPVQTTAQTPAAQSSLDELIAAQQAQFQAWLAIQQNATPAAPEAAVATPVQPATASVQPATQPVAPLANLTEATTTSALTDDGATPARTLADALPTWPSENMHYGDVHTALFGEDTDAPASTAMSMVEVDLQAIDAVVEQEDTPDLGTGATRYAPFLMRALCMAAQEFNGTDQPVHISVNGTGLDDRRIENAHDKRLSALTRELSDDASADQSQPEPTVAINLSSSLGGHLSVEIGDGQVPTVSLVYLSKRPIATRDRLGCTAITTHSMGLLSVAASTTPTRADQYLDLVRDILETRDWTTELD